jgi:hypothetical protein
MPNSSSSIEIVVERRRIGRAASAPRACDVWEVLEEKSIWESVLFGLLWNNKRSGIAQRARRHVAQVCIPCWVRGPRGTGRPLDNECHKNKKRSIWGVFPSNRIQAWPTSANNIRTTVDAVLGGTVLQRSGVYTSDPMPMAMIRGVGTIEVARLAKQFLVRHGCLSCQRDPGPPWSLGFVFAL